MATLVLSAAGAALGGPIGAAVGRFAGRQIDRSFGASSSRRLSDLRLPSAQYGDPIPAVFGQMRVAGVVLWVSAPVATAVVSKTGSAQSQSISFALAVSSTRIDKVERIWADGRLIRDGEGQQNVTFTVRLHDGSDDQASDGLIAATEGEEVTPAYRGIAYLVFEGFDLSSFGNRLPLITAEVSSASDPLTAERVLQDRLNLALTDPDDCSNALVGAALAGDNVAEALTPFMDATSPSFSFGDSGWSMARMPKHHLIEAEFWAPERQTGNGNRRDVGSQSVAPTRVSLRYFDPALDFAAGEKSAKLPGPEKLRRIELPAAMDGAVAKALAFAQLAKKRRRDEQFWLRLPVSFARIGVGDYLSSESAPDVRWVVSKKRLSVTGVALKLSSQTRPVSEQSVEAGGAATQLRLAMRPQSIALIELPGEQTANKPTVAVVVTGGTSPYQQVPVSLSYGGATTQIRSAPAEGACGYLLEELLPGPSEIVDARSSLRVAFADDPLLTSCEGVALQAGANLMWIGGEFVQFGTARPVGEGVYLLSDLLRGRYGSEVQTPHPVGTAAILLDAARSCTIELDESTIGSDVAAEMPTFDGGLMTSGLTIQGLASKPWSPAHLKADETEQGLGVRWVRRGKTGAPWLDFVDAPVGYAHETYVVAVESSDGRRLEQVVNELRSHFDQQSLGELGPRPWSIKVFQVGDLVPGYSSRIVI